MSDPVIFSEALLAGGMETVFREAGPLDLMTDTFDTGPVTRTPNIGQLTRNTQRPSLSPVASRTGRTQQQFQFPVELNGSGITDGTRAPSWGRFMRACNYAETQFLAPGLATSRKSPDNAPRDAEVALTEGAGSAFTGASPRLVMLTATGAAEVTVTSVSSMGVAAHSETNEGAASAAVINGPEGSTMTLTYTGDLTVGDQFFFWFVPAGHLYTPHSDPATAESMFMYMYAGNKRHLITGARGSFSLSATGGELATATFSFTGDFHKPEAVGMPALGTYGYGPYPVPPMFEQAYLQSQGRVLACPTTFALDTSNTVTARLCANAKGANDGAIITARTPTLNFNMDSVPLDVMDPWSEMLDAKQLQISGNVGTEPGNMVSFLANGQYTGATDAELNEQRKSDVTMALRGLQGNDELMIFAS